VEVAVTDDEAMGEFADLTGTEAARDIPEVLKRLDAMQDYAEVHFERGEKDGIACFTRLYRVITAAIDDRERAGKFVASGGFLTRLDIEFAERYFEAVRTYARDREATPGCWKVLFDRRGDEHIPEASFAAAGVNAHINFDLSAALLRTWAHVAPDPEEHRDLQLQDFDKINTVFAEHMDELRKQLHTLLSESLDGSFPDFLADKIADGVVVLTRAMAWEVADHLWHSPDRDGAVAQSDRILGQPATASWATSR
jgi:Family of unknown function (DUF5995)